MLKLTACLVKIMILSLIKKEKTAVALTPPEKPFDRQA